MEDNETIALADKIMMQTNTPELIKDWDDLDPADRLTVAKSIVLASRMSSGLPKRKVKTEIPHLKQPL